MAYPYFYINVVVRVLLLAVSCMAFALTWVGSGNYFAILNLGLLIILQVFLFIYYLNRTNRDLALFFDSVRNEDSGIIFNRTRKKYRNIYRSMDEVNDQIKAIRIKYAAQDQYFKTIVESIRTGLITFGPDKKIDIMNKAAKNMLGVSAFAKIDRLSKIGQELGDTLDSINPSEKRLILVNTGSGTVHLSVNSTALRLIDKELKIITFHDIQQELDKKEMESWQKLIRILNHEIMNSLAPIISTATTLKDLLSEKDSNERTITNHSGNRVLEKTISGLSIICERSEGLKSFVENYKTLNALPAPVMTTFKIQDLFNDCKLLLGEELHTGEVNCTTTYAAPDMELTADKSQIQQVMLNLLRNSIESLAETNLKNKVIQLRAIYSDTGKTVLQISDNGKGIAPELIDHIFIPFFSTREKGSGIGLSLSRKIMHMHQGSIAAHSVPYRETVFTLAF